MPGVFFQRHHSQQNALGGIESPSLSTRMAAVNDLQKSLVNFKLRSADCDLDVARNLLQQHIHLIEVEDQEVIGLLYDDLEDIESRLEKTKSRLKRWVLNMHFKRVSKTTYMVIKDASDRAIDRQIRNKLREASSSRGLPTSTEQTSVQPTSPDPHAILPIADSRPSSTLTDAAVSSVDMTALQSQTTGEPAVLLRLRRQGDPPLHYVAALSPNPRPEHGIVEEAEMASIASSRHPQFEFSASDILDSRSDESLRSSGEE
ncbi:hypothetical protein EDB92DRAFT_1867131 [Lactarius akahatsu]|uniref:Uncharacterized protein n=1 Tax=Lactarius akahatsu TaxID=416441 RepID=A0AAD4LDE3_9AGAM|nr:hypothetical protein EDB92DRAFT_1867131 [Lactarius akahatsu]